VYNTPSYGGGGGGGGVFNDYSFTSPYSFNTVNTPTGGSPTVNAPTFSEVQGQGAVGLGPAVSFTGPGAAVAAANDGSGGGSGVTGGFGVTPAATSAQNPALLAQDNSNFDQDWSDATGGKFTINDTPQSPQQALGIRPPSAFDNAMSTIGRGFTAAGEYIKDNPWAARLGVDATGLLLNAASARKANQLAQEQLELQRRVQSQNEAQANLWNAQAKKSLNEANSLYNPQQMAVRSMADTRAATDRVISQNEADMRKRGMSSADIAAETRRARLGGATGAITAYGRGLDAGRSAQQSAISGAKGLSQQYTGTPNYGAADQVLKAGQLTAQSTQNLLNTYLGNPVGRTELDMYRAMSQGNRK
jgi:hypothetical protein